MTQNNNFNEILKATITVLLGCVLCLALISFVILSAPVYLFRILVIYLAKLWRPDLDEILDITSTAFGNDFFTGKPPRANVVCTQHIQGHVTAKEVESLVLKNWINAKYPETGENPYKKFQQYPVRWLGFTFWKKDNVNFSTKNHVFTLYDNETCVSEEQIDTQMEKLLNLSFPRNQSPWSFHVIENYNGAKTSGSSGHQSVIIFTFHHCITDGYGIMTAFVEGLYEYGSLNREATVEKHVQKNSFQQSIWGMLTLSVNLFWEASKFLPRQLGGDPWLVPDKNKKWSQIGCRVDTIPLQDILAIKSKFGGSLISILTSAVSAATYKMLNSDRDGKNSSIKSMLCLSTLQHTGVKRMKTLSNEVTGQTFDLPTTKMLGPAQRLRKVNQVLETNKQSVMPIVMHGFAVILGSHFYPVCEAIVKNRSVPIGISIVPVPIPVKFAGKPILCGDTLAGGLQGDLGICIAGHSYGKEVRVNISAEAGLMSRDELKLFVQFFTDEIRTLRDLAQNGNM